MAPTYFLAHFFGFFLVILSLAMLARKKETLEALYEIVASKGLLFVMGLLSLFIGLFVVIIHNVWNGSFLALVVTLLGWAMLCRGAVLLFFPQAFRRIFRAFHIETSYYTLSLLALALGVYLSYMVTIG